MKNKKEIKQYIVSREHLLTCSDISDENINFIKGELKALRWAIRGSNEQ